MPPIWTIFFASLALFSYCCVHFIIAIGKYKCRIVGLMLISIYFKTVHILYAMVIKYFSNIDSNLCVNNLFPSTLCFMMRIAQCVHKIYVQRLSDSCLKYLELNSIFFFKKNSIQLKHFAAATQDELGIN